MLRTRHFGPTVLKATTALFQQAQTALIRRGVQPPIEKTGVPSMSSDDIGGLLGDDPALVELAAERFWASRIDGPTEMPIRTRIVLPSGGAAGPIGERKPLKFGAILIDLEGLLPYKFGGGTAISNEAAFKGGDVVMRGTQNRLIAAAVDSANAHALSDAAVSADAPAGLAYGAETIAATSDLAAGVRALIEAVGPGVDPRNLAFLTDSLTAAKLGTFVDSAGALVFPNISMFGGDVLGIPVVVTRSSPSDGSPPEGNLLLIDAAAVAFHLDGISFEVSEHGTVELSDAPTGEGATPAAQSQQTVSLWQNELLGLKAILRASWKVLRQNAVAVLVGI